MDWKCSEICDGHRHEDTHQCDGPWACNRTSCMTEVHDEGEEPRACPVTSSLGTAGVACQSCSQCAEGQAAFAAAVADGTIPGWGTGCARECSMMLCKEGEVYDWTDRTCKGCASLWNSNLCSRNLLDRDVTGNLLRVYFPKCVAKKEGVLTKDLRYGECNECPAISCGPFQFPDSGCNCSMCLRPGTHSREYLSVAGLYQPVHCQVEACAVDRTGVADNGLLCQLTCKKTVCARDEWQQDCLLPHQTRCVRDFPAQPHVNVRRVGVVSAAANMLETLHPPFHRWASFENVLLTLEERSVNQHQCVWNSAGIKDNVFTPAGISSVFWPPKISSAYEYRERGTQFCRTWPGTAPGYPLLPLQNTVSFAGDTQRRIMLNSTARVVSYEYTGISNVEDVRDQLQARVPTHVPDSGELLLSLMLWRYPVAQLQFHIPDDRRDSVPWARWWRLSFHVQELTRPDSFLFNSESPVRLKVHQVGIDTNLFDASRVTGAVMEPSLQGLFRDTSGAKTSTAVADQQMLQIVSDSAFVATNSTLAIHDCVDCYYAQVALAGDSSLGAAGLSLSLPLLPTQIATLMSSASVPPQYKCMGIVATLAGISCIRHGANATRFMKIDSKAVDAMQYIGNSSDGFLLVYRQNKYTTLEIPDSGCAACICHAPEIPLLESTPVPRPRALVAAPGGVYGLWQSGDAWEVGYASVRRLQRAIHMGLESSSICSSLITDPISCSMQAHSNDTMAVACAETSKISVLLCNVYTGATRHVSWKAVSVQGYVSLSVTDTGLLVGVGGTVYTVSTDMHVERLPDSHSLNGTHFIRTAGAYIVFGNLTPPYPAAGKCPPGFIEDSGRLYAERCDNDEPSGVCYARCMEDEGCRFIDLTSGTCSVVKSTTWSEDPDAKICKKTTSHAHTEMLSSKGVSLLAVIPGAKLFASAGWGGAAVFARAALAAHPFQWVHARNVMHHGQQLYLDRNGTGLVRRDGEQRITQLMMPSAVWTDGEFRTTEQFAEYTWQLMPVQGTFYLLLTYEGLRIGTKTAVARDCAEGYVSIQIIGSVHIRCDSRSTQHLMSEIFTQGPADILRILAIDALLGTEQLLVYEDLAAVQQESNSADVMCSGVVKGHEVWVCGFSSAASGIVLTFERTDLGALEYERSIGVDEFTVLPMLSSRASANTAWTDVYVPTRTELRLAGVGEAIRNDSGWERVHVTVSVVAPLCVSWTATIQRLADDGILHSSQHRLRLSSCTANVSCGLEIPVETLNARRMVRVRIEGCESVPRVDVSIPPHTTLWECGYSQFLASGSCVSCQSSCPAGTFSSSCPFLTGAVGTCLPCAPLPPNAHFAEGCTWECDDGFWTHGDGCMQCSHQTCEVGSAWQECSHDADGLCVSCPLQSNSHFEIFGSDTCARRCNQGFFRTESDICEACHTLHELKQGVEISRVEGKFYRFQNCSSVSDSFFEECLNPEGGVVVADGDAFNVDCTFQCHDNHHLSTDVLSTRSAIPVNSAATPFELSLNTSAHWTGRVCVDCEVLLDIHGNKLPSAAYAMDSACSAVCLEPYLPRLGTCVMCKADDCAVGEYLTGDDCTQCLPCVRKHGDANFEFSTRGDVDRNNSCMEQCKPGMFDEMGLGVCKYFSTPTCDAGQYMQQGSPYNDVECRECSTCYGSSLQEACTETKDAVCSPCNGTMGLGEFWTGSACEKACKQGFVMNVRSGNCEICLSKCPPGSSPASPRHNCSHCQACVPPQTPDWEWVDECVWTCRVGFVTANGACQPQQNNFRPVIASTLSVRCPRGTAPAKNFQCQSCNASVQTPKNSLENVTWEWRMSGMPCVWRCIPPLVKHRVARGAGISCVTWSVYVSSAEVERQKAPQFTRKSNIIAPVSVLGSWQFIVVAACILLLITLVIFTR